MHQSNNQARLHVDSKIDFPATDKMLRTIITFFLLVLVAEAFVVQPPAYLNFFNLKKNPNPPLDLVPRGRGCTLLPSFRLAPPTLRPLQFPAVVFLQSQTSCWGRSFASWWHYEDGTPCRLMKLEDNGLEWWRWFAREEDIPWGSALVCGTLMLCWQDPIGVAKKPNVSVVLLLIFPHDTSGFILSWKR